MTSGTELAALAFAPDRETLESAIELIESEGDGSGSAIGAEQRRVAFERFQRLPIPGPRPGREWRYDYDRLAFEGLRWGSDRRRMATLPFVADGDGESDVPALATANTGGLVHIGSTFIETPAQTARDPRVLVMPLADARRRMAEARPYLGDVLERDRFANLAIAFQNCGAFVYVPDGVVLDDPIQLIFTYPEPLADAVFPSIVVVLGEGARATVIERHIGEGAPFVCGLASARAGAGAQLDYVVLQQTGEEARLFFSRVSRSAREGAVRWHAAELGGGLVRTNIESRLDAEGATGQIGTLFFSTGMQHVELLTQAEHAVAETTSQTHVRSAATDRGQGRYFGNIVIRPHAHGSNALLRDDALLLSKRAHIDSVPALEIGSNDVRAFHGATVGSLDEDTLFYAQSRGLTRGDALRIVTLGFFEPVIGRFPADALRDEVRTALDTKLDEATEIDA